MYKENLPFIAKHAKVVEFRNTITAQGLSTPKVAQHSNTVAKRLVTAVLKVDTDKLPECRNDDLLAWVLGAQVNLEPTLGLVHVLEVILDWKATKRRELSLVLKVDPVVVVCFRQDWIRGPFDLENVIADADSSAPDVTPETNDLGTDLQLQAKIICKGSVLGKDHVTLAVVFKVLALPSFNYTQNE
jgi:hypothetical protein